MTTPTTPVRLVVITGLSGAGKRTAAHALEDLGWYVVDNLPPSMIKPFVAQARERGITRVGVAVDVRGREQFEQLPGVFADLQADGTLVDILFIEASDEVIVKRQESARRPLPLQDDGRLLDGIVKERRMLATLRANADLVVDTTNLNVHQLQDRVAHAYGGNQADELRIAVVSFGFKNGLPLDADLVVDVRFLPNPHWVPELRPQTGLAQPVRDFVLGQPGAAAFLDHLEALFAIVAAGYLREGKRRCTLAVGCTGGKHRSTAIAEELTRRLRAQGFEAKVLHRDLGLE